MIIQPFPKRHILDSYKLKEFADDYFSIDGNGRMFSKWVKNNVGFWRICSLRAIYPFPTLFSKEF